MRTQTRITVYFELRLNRETVSLCLKIMPSDLNRPFEDIDWDAIRSDLRWDDPENEETTESSRLRLRAQQYAARVDWHDTDAQTLPTLVFDLGGENYGVDVMLVRSLRELPRLTRVPGSPHFYKGVVNLRGQIVTVMDLRPFFEMKVDDEKPPAELVVVKYGWLEIALLAHHVFGVRQVPVTDISSTGEIRYTRGVTSDRLVLLDAAAMFEDPRLVAGGPEE